VQDADLALAREIDLSLLQMHAVSDLQPAPDQIEVGEQLEVPLSMAGMDQLDLGAMLGRVRVHRQPALGGGRRHSAVQLGAAAEREPRRERASQPAAGRALEAVRERQRLPHSLGRRLDQPARHALAHVHQALAHRRVERRAGQRLEHDVGVVHGLHRQHRGGAALQQLGRGEPRGGAHRGRLVRRLERPDELLQPGEQRHGIRHAAEQSLHQVHVGLDEPGQHQHPCGVDDRDPWLGARRPDLVNQTVPDHEIRAEHSRSAGSS
jgi:hypothetical protein